MMLSLYTWSTPNGYKASIALEELELDYEICSVDLQTGQQKAPEFLKINPNGRIPALVDHSINDFAIFESGAILMYLAEKTGRLLPTDAKGRSKVVQWLMFQMSGIGPMQGQANMFLRYASEKIPFAIDRYQKETLRLYQVLEHQLANHEFLAGDYSIADIATFPWVKFHSWAGLSVAQLPNLQRWLRTVESRPGVQRGMTIPAPPSVSLEP